MVMVMVGRRSMLAMCFGASWGGRAWRRPSPCRQPLEYGCAFVGLGRRHAAQKGHGQNHGYAY